MAEIENSIAQCCKQLRLSTNFAGQALTLEGDTPQKYLLNLLENEISYRIEKRKSNTCRCMALKFLTFRNPIPPHLIERCYSITLG